MRSARGWLPRHFLFDMAAFRYKKAISQYRTERARPHEHLVRAPWRCHCAVEGGGALRSPGSRREDKYRWWPLFSCWGTSGAGGTRARARADAPPLSRVRALRTHPRAAGSRAGSRPRARAPHFLPFIRSPGHGAGERSGSRVRQGWLRVRRACSARGRSVFLIHSFGNTHTHTAPAGCALALTPPSSTTETTREPGVSPPQMLGVS